MTRKSSYLIDLIFEKLKNYKTKEIFLEKENLEKFVFSLLEETEFKEDN
tara:strand:+ start:196 stop:342 length:147 start_codon:yes stop_codon:yes gene_type:complete